MNLLNKSMVGNYIFQTKLVSHARMRTLGFEYEIIFTEDKKFLRCVYSIIGLTFVKQSICIPTTVIKIKNVIFIK